MSSLTQIRNFADATAALKQYIPAVKEITGKDITLDRMLPLMKLLGNPEAKLKVIHIAGTSGKTSTAYYIASMLHASGQKVGLTVSPHIESISERIQIGLQPLSESEFCSSLSKFLKIIEPANPQPTYFELILAFAYWYFAKANVDYAVIETGLGGLHDASNVAARADKICVITDIGIDHTKVLGKTIRLIAVQKAGIIHQHNEVFCYKQSPVVMQVLQEAVLSKNAKLNVIPSVAEAKEINTLPLFQRRNLGLARAVYNQIAKRDGLLDLSHSQIISTMSTRIPGRMEVFQYHGKTIILDGAHNPQKLRALLASVSYRYHDQPVAVLAGFVRSRKPRLQSNLRELIKSASYMVVTSFVPNQEMYTNSADPVLVAEYCNQLGFNDIAVEPQPLNAFSTLLNRPEPVLLITGSFYLLHHYRPIILTSTPPRLNFRQDEPPAIMPADSGSFRGVPEGYEARGHGAGGVADRGSEPERQAGRGTNND